MARYYKTSNSNTWLSPNKSIKTEVEPSIKKALILGNNLDQKSSQSSENEKRNISSLNIRM